MDLRPHIEKFSRRFEELETALSDPQVFNDPKRAQELSREYARMKELVGQGNAYLKSLEELEQNHQLLESEEPGSELYQLAKEESARLEQEQQRLERAIQHGLVPPDPGDSKNTILEIRAGAGGSESALFVADLVRMYTRYAEALGWEYETLESSPSDLGGFKEIILSIKGEQVFKRLKYERGVHRVQRVPETEAQGRIHTSTATVAVLPEAEEVDVEISPEEIEVSISRASGPGGQSVNTTDSAVQLLHKPSGMIVRCADQRSQIKNRARAMTILRSRLLDQKIAEENARYTAERRAQVGSGERNERIRTYNFPQNRVTDHRIELTLHNLPEVIEGNLNCLIEPLMDHDLSEKMKTLKL